MPAEAVGKRMSGSGLKPEARWHVLPETIRVAFGNPGTTRDGGHGSPCPEGRTWPICDMALMLELP